MIMYRFLAGFFAAFALSLVAACGGDSSGLGGNEAKLVSIQVTPAAVSKAIGLTQPYSAIGTYSSGPNRDITLAVDWSSSDVAKVSINGAGLATAKALGASNITASLGAIKSNTATFTVTSAELVSIQITPAAVSKAAGLTQQYTALGTYTDGSTPDITTSVVWRSGNVAAVSVTPAGLATGQVLGTSAITASLGAVTFNAGSFAVTAATLVAIHITPAAVSKAMGLTQQYTATGTYTDGSTPNISASVSWNSSDTAKARISTSGLATAVAVGSTSITAVMSGIISNPGNLTVTAAALVSIQVSPANASKAVGLTQQYTAIGTYTDGSTPDISASVSWNSSDTAKATISMSGLATAVAVGSSNITAMMGGINSNSAALSVTAATLVSIQITPAIAKLAVGKTQQYTATGTYTDGSTPDISTTVSWNSSDTAKATISTSGLATGVAVGASNISASLNGLTSNIATLTVAAPAESAGPMNTARYNHTATQLADGKVLVTGGDGGAGTLASSELYDPLTGAWTTTGSMSTARVNHATTLLANGKV